MGEIGKCLHGVGHYVGPNSFFCTICGETIQRGYRMGKQEEKKNKELSVRDRQLKYNDANYLCTLAAEFEEAPRTGHKVIGGFGSYETIEITDALAQRIIISLRAIAARIMQREPHPYWEWTGNEWEDCFTEEPDGDKERRSIKWNS